MSISCTICGTWYPTPDRDTIDICDTCFVANFAGAQPPLDLPSAREALAAYVSSSTQMSWRQFAHWQSVRRQLDLEEMP